MIRKRYFLVAAALPFLLAGCFTGVESTKKISAADVRRETKNENTVFGVEEERIAAAILPPSPSLWKPGDGFLIGDKRVSLAFTSAPVEILPVPGDTIRFAGFSEARNVLGTLSTDILFKTSSGDNLAYRVEIPLEEILKRETLEIPFTVSLEMVSEADSLLKGKTAFVNSGFRFKDSDGGRTDGRKYQQVTITGVDAGTPELPMRVHFTEKNDKESTGYFLYMTPGGSRTSTRNFSALFSLSDPREKYPAITDEMWDKIVMSGVAPGMTRQECRLAIGSPVEVIHGHSYSSVYERWIYQDGRNLIFEDGLLKAAR